MDESPLIKKGCSGSGRSPRREVDPSQFLIGGMLEREQGVVGAGHGQQGLVQLSLGRSLMPGLGVPDDEDHHESQRGHQGLEDDLPPRGTPRRC